MFLRYAPGLLGTPQIDGAILRMRAFGTYSMRVVNPGLFLREIVGTDGEFTTDEKILAAVLMDELFTELMYPIAARDYFVQASTGPTNAWYSLHEYQTNQE